MISYHIKTKFKNAKLWNKKKNWVLNAEFVTLNLSTVPICLNWTVIVEATCNMYAKIVTFDLNPKEPNVTFAEINGRL